MLSPARGLEPVSGPRGACLNQLFQQQGGPLAGGMIEALGLYPTGDPA